MLVNLAHPVFLVTLALKVNKVEWVHKALKACKVLEEIRVAPGYRETSGPQVSQAETELLERRERKALMEMLVHKDFRDREAYQA